MRREFVRISGSFFIGVVPKLMKRGALMQNMRFGKGRKDDDYVFGEYFSDPCRYLLRGGIVPQICSFFGNCSKSR